MAIAYVIWVDVEFGFLRVLLLQLRLEMEDFYVDVVANKALGLCNFGNRELKFQTLGLVL